MAIVTGTYVDSTGAPLPANLTPTVEVIPSKGAVTVAGQSVATHKRTVTPNVTTGAYSFDLIPTVDVLDAGFFYRLRGFYLEPTGYGDDAGFTRVDVFEHKIHVPTAGGSVGALASAGRPFESWVFTDPTWTDGDATAGTPANLPTVIIPGAYYLSADVNDPDLGTGDLWKASV